ncbi:MAG: site-specific DNA-methyltransferase [Chloroflexi bacterium]|nr:site-specific DNA-methyltransferase [Chloroflexota bacterium]
MVQQQTVQIGEAKGRPMLHWVGKRALDHVTAFPAQLVETFNPTGEPNEAQGLLFHGDNKDVLAWLLAHGYRGKVNLIYIDPPFDSGADYIRRVELRGVPGRVKMEGETYTLGEQIQYTDIWANDTYLQFMYERLLLLKELLGEDGSIWLHSDWRKNHHLRCLMDEVFGSENFRAQVTWRTMTSSGYKGKKSLGRSHADLLYYSKGDRFLYNPVYLEMSHEMRARYKHVDPDGRRFKDSYLGDASAETLEELREAGLLYVTSTGGYRIKHYLDEAKGTLVDDVWTDIDPENSQALVQTGYPTQKPEALLERIIELTSNPGDLVLDCFAGSGTTPAMAQRLARRWIAADINKGAIQTTSRRLQRIIREQMEAGATAEQLALLSAEEGDGTAPPPALSFSVYRVNDYDLQVQHNEAVNLAVEHIGIERTKTDTFFEGTLGKRLVKIVPFNHPLTPLDLQLLQDELQARPSEDRDIVVVCLGKEIAADAWLEEYNRHRPINKMEVIELRTDQKYGKFFVHQPAQAAVAIERGDGQIVVEIEDFISPTIVERLEMDTPLFKAQIPDWRAMVDVVLVDTAYDGEVFHITLSDVPERKNDLVSGRYELPAPEGPTTVAVKIIDMLGEEVLVVAGV